MCTLLAEPFDLWLLSWLYVGPKKLTFFFSLSDPVLIPPLFSPRKPPAQLKKFMNLHESSWNMVKKWPNYSWNFMKIHETSWIFMKMTDVKMTQMGFVNARTPFVKKENWLNLGMKSILFTNGGKASFMNFENRFIGGLFTRADSISCKHLGISCWIHWKRNKEVLLSMAKSWVSMSPETLRLNDVVFWVVIWIHNHRFLPRTGVSPITFGGYYNSMITKEVLLTGFPVIWRHFLIFDHFNTIRDKFINDLERGDFIYRTSIGILPFE